jgi:hypothetical protein
MLYATDLGLGTAVQLLLRTESVLLCCGHGAPTDPGTATAGTAMAFYFDKGGTVPTAGAYILTLGTWYALGTA